VLATGFETSRYLAGIEVIGEGGQELHERWGDDPQAYLGVAVSDFPNFFMLYGPNTNQGGNSIVYVLEAGAYLVVDAVERLARSGGQLAVRPEAEAAFNKRISNELEGTVWTQCDSYFRSPSGRIVTQWPYTEQDYERETRAFTQVVASRPELKEVLVQRFSRRPERASPRRSHCRATSSSWSPCAASPAVEARGRRS
jgi:hypothetical protein